MPEGTREGDEGTCARGGRPCGGRGMGRLYRFAEPLILISLCRRGRAHGYELLDEVNATSLSDREAPIDTGVLYRTLRALEAAGLLVSDWETEGGGAARRVYELTGAGAEHLERWADHLERIAAAMARAAAGAREALADRADRREDPSAPAGGPGPTAPGDGPGDGRDFEGGPARP